MVPRLGRLTIPCIHGNPLHQHSRAKPILDAAEELGRMLAALIRALNRRRLPPNP